MYKKILSLMVVLICLGWVSYASAGSPNMKEGLWEITMTMEMPGMPMKMPPRTYTHCLTKKDMVPQKEEPNQECKMIKHDVKGDTVTWVIECKTPEGTAVSNGRVAYKGTTFEGVIKVKHAGVEVTQNLKGKWIGQCK
ncbi:MAG: DUF3617 domain-containing protein [Thermodesulfovibrionales bacterium]